MEDLQKKLVQIREEKLALFEKLNLIKAEIEKNMKKYQEYLIEYMGFSTLQEEIKKLKKNIEMLMEKNETGTYDYDISRRKSELKHKVAKYKNLKTEYDNDIAEYGKYLLEYNDVEGVKTLIAKKEKEEEFVLQSLSGAKKETATAEKDLAK